MFPLNQIIQTLPLVAFHQTPFPKFKSQHTPTSLPAKVSNSNDGGGIPGNDVKTLAQFRSRHNDIRVLEVSRRADSPFAGSRLLLLDGPGNIHSISFLFKPFTDTYFDVFATLPPILPPGPVAVLGFGAGTAARLLFHLYPDSEVHGWELDESVIAVAREYFGLGKLEKEMKNKLFIYVGNALYADIDNGFAGIFVDLFSKGSLIPELQQRDTWVRLKRRLRSGGRVMVNCGGSCVEAEDERRNGRLVMEATLRAMAEVFARELFVLNLGLKEEDSCVACTGPRPDTDKWKGMLVKRLRGYVDMWTPHED